MRDLPCSNEARSEGSSWWLDIASRDCRGEGYGNPKIAGSVMCCEVWTIDAERNRVIQVKARRSVEHIKMFGSNVNLA